MEDNQPIKKTTSKVYFAPFLVFVVVVIAISHVVFAYSPHYTHPDLTEEIAKLWNLRNGSQDLEISQNEIQWMREGAINEDTPARWINHFFDPINNKGWSGKHFGTLTPEEGLYQGESMAPRPAIASINWVTNQEYQAAYGRQYGNQTWQKAIASYIDGDKKLAFTALGHILHLIEDASVPDHTRNDTHADLFGDPGSPYEKHSKKYTNYNKLNIAENLKGKDLLNFPTVQDAFRYLANYSNNNFFSEDTISNEEFEFPDIKKLEKRISNVDGEKNKFLYDSQKQIYLALLTDNNTHTINDEALVLPSYFSNLSSHAVLTGASVLDLFFREVEKYKNIPESLPEILKDSNEALSSYLIKSPRLALVNTGNFFDKVGTNIKIYAGAFSSFSVSLLPAQLSGLFANNTSAPVAQGSQEAFGPFPPLVTVSNPVPVTAPPAPAPAPATLQQASQPIADIPVVEWIPPPATPVVEPIVMPAVSIGQETTVLGAPAPVYRGSGSVTGVSPDALLAQNEPTPAAEAQSQTQAENVDAFATSTEDVFTETETATTTDGVATSTDPVIDNTATSTEDIIIATSTDPITPMITDFTDSIVINEVAWMGTKAQANDEWIELYNKTDYDIDLAGWTLESRNKRFSISLENAIPAKGYFLLERTASTTTDVAENMVYAGALNNDGPDANLYLKNGTTTIDVVDFNKWPAGDNGKRYSMERVSAYATSTYATNWKSYGDPDAVPYAKDAKGDDIFGTPGRKNSVSGFYTPTGSIVENTTWEKEYSPYLVSSTIIITNGATLTIEPGAVVKFTKGIPSGGGKIDVRGALHAEGAAEEMITFTSLLDDAADGIDSNRDGAATSPASGDWHNIIFSNTEAESAVRYAHVRYGGLGINYNPSAFSPTYTGALSMQGGSVEISDSIIEDSSAIAVYIDKGAAPKILRTTILNTAQNTYSGVQPYGVGIFIAADASAEIVGNTLTNNTIGIQSASVTDAPVIVKDNKFDGNAKNGEFIKGYLNWNLENSGNEDVDHKGGFDIQFTVLDGQSKTIHGDAMPYIIGGGAQVLAGGALSIEPGAVFKFSKFSSGADVFFSVKGTLSAVGTEDKPIVFTAFTDDGDGYDSNDSDIAPVAGAWKYIAFSGATSSDSILEHVTVRYGGQGKDMCPYAVIAGPCMEYYGAVRIDGASPTIRNSVLENNLGIALFTEGIANPTIENSEIRDTQEAKETATTTIGGYGISTGPESQPILTDNTYANNAEDVVYRE